MDKNEQLLFYDILEMKDNYKKLTRVNFSKVIEALRRYSDKEAGEYEV